MTARPKRSVRLDVPGHLARRLLPATVAIGLLIGVVAPALVWHFEMRAAQEMAEIHARELASHLETIMIEGGSLWRYHAQNYLRTLAIFLPEKDIRKIAVADEHGADVPALAYVADTATRDWPGATVRASVPVHFNDRVAAKVAIEVSAARAAVSALRVFVVLGIAGGALALFMYAFPVSIARRLDRETQEAIHASTALYVAADQHLAQTRQLTVVCRDIAATLDRGEAGARAVAGAVTLFGAAPTRVWYAPARGRPRVMAGAAGTEEDAGPVSASIAARQVRCEPVAGGGERWILPLAVGDRCVEALDLTILRALSDVESELVTLFASSVAVALVNSDLHETARRTLGRLEARNAELDSFVHTVSHDLKTPLIAIHGFADALVEAVGSEAPGPIARYVERITSNVARMERLLHDMLDIARIGRSGRPAEAIGVDGVVKAVLDDLQPQIAARGIDVVVGDLGVVWGVPSEVRSVFQNLLGNAVKYLGETPAPRIEIGRTPGANGTGEYFVRDNGIGIDAAYHDKIFQVFERLEDVVVPGSGVGLAIVRRVVDHAGGRVRVESQRGRGATFWLTWPPHPESG